MNRISPMFVCQVLLAILCLMTDAGCSRSDKSAGGMPQKEMEIKLNEILDRMVHQCKDQQEIEQLKAAQIFHDLNGMPMELAGISVPIGSNYIHVTFTLEHFRKNNVDVLATEALEDLHLAKATKANGPKNPNGS